MTICRMTKDNFDLGKNFFLKNEIVISIDIICQSVVMTFV